MSASLCVCETERQKSRSQKYARQTLASAKMWLQQTSTTSSVPRRTMTWFQLVHTPRTPPSYVPHPTHRQGTTTTSGVETQRVASWHLPALRAASSTLTSMTSALGVVAPVTSMTPAWGARERGTLMTAVWVALGTESSMTEVWVVVQQRVSITAAVCTGTMDCMMALSEKVVISWILNQGLEVTLWRPTFIRRTSTMARKTVTKPTSEPMETENPTKQIWTATEMMWILTVVGDTSTNKNGSAGKTTEPLNNYFNVCAAEYVWLCVRVKRNVHVHGCKCLYSMFLKIRWEQILILSQLVGCNTNHLNTVAHTLKESHHMTDVHSRHTSIP